MDELEQAIKLLRQMYNFGKDYFHEKDPVAYALRHTYYEWLKRNGGDNYEQEKLF